MDSDNDDAAAGSDDDYSFSKFNPPGFTEDMESTERARVSIARARKDGQDAGQDGQDAASRASRGNSSNSSTTSGHRRTASGSSNIREEEAPVKKKPKNRAVPKDLPPELLAFKCEHRARMVIGEEMDTANKEDPGPCHVAQTITVGKEGQANYKSFDLNKLTSYQLRKLAINFGYKGGGGKKKFDCRKALAGRVDMGTAYDSTVNPASTANEKRINTMLRMVNCCFLPRFRETFLQLNDQISREKFETEGGTSNNPIREFWEEVSSTANDAEDTDVSIVLHSGEDEDTCLYNMVTENDIDLNTFNNCPWTACRQHMLDLVKARNNVLAAMKESGHHCNDPAQHLRNKFLTVRKGLRLPDGPVYYLIAVAKEHPALDQAHTQVLSDGLQTDSSVPIEDRSNNNKKKTSDQKLIEALERSSIAIMQCPNLPTIGYA